MMGKGSGKKINKTVSSECEKRGQTERGKRAHGTALFEEGKSTVWGGRRCGGRGCTTEGGGGLRGKRNSRQEKTI